MKWLQWASMNLATGLGGVEVHARSLSREFALKGVTSSFSQDPQLSGWDQWDVIQTHGSAPLPWGVCLRLLFSRKRPILVHTLHGSTLERMIACREPFWPGGYLAYLRELRGVLLSNVVVSVNPGLSIFKFARFIGKVCVTSWNGWDSGSSEEFSAALPEKLEILLRDDDRYWLFIGRGSDPMKGVDRIKELLRRQPEIRIIAAPGEGFENHPQAVLSGPLNSGQIHRLLTAEKVLGLLVPSRYEGLPLVVLEALGEGLPVVACEVGGLKFLDSRLNSLYRVNSASDHEVVSAMEKFTKLAFAPNPSDDRLGDRDHNRQLLYSWRQVAEIYLDAVSGFRKAAKEGKR